MLSVKSSSANKLDDANTHIEKVRSAQRGNVHSFEQLINENKVALYRIALVHMRNQTEALDILDEAIAKIWLKIVTLRDPGSFCPWIKKITVNCCNDRLRKKIKTRSFLDEDELIAPQSNLDDNLDLKSAICKLKEPYYSVIVLKYYDDLTIEQVSKTLSLPIGTAKSHLHRALLLLRKIMKGDKIC